MNKILSIILFVSCTPEFNADKEAFENYANNYVDSLILEMNDSVEILFNTQMDSVKEFNEKRYDSLNRIIDERILTETQDFNSYIDSVFGVVELEILVLNKFANDTIQGINDYFDSLKNSVVYDNIFIDGNEIDSFEIGFKETKPYIRTTIIN